MSRFQRRQFLLSTVAVLAASFARAGNIPRIGYLSIHTAGFDPYGDAFFIGMRELGYKEGKNVVYERRWADEKVERLAGLANELVLRKVDVIVTVQTQGIEAAQRATSTIPIVFTSTIDPVSSGFVKSLAHPGGNITGLSTSGDDIGPKQLELLMAAVPKCSRVALLENPTNVSIASMHKTIESTAQKVSVPIQPLYARMFDEIEPAFIAARNARADAIIVMPDGFLLGARKHIVNLALRHRLPTMYAQDQFVMAGGMMAYGPSYADNSRRGASYVDKILRGAKPSDLPVEQPIQFELVVNVTTAKTLGITFPQSILGRADRVIE